MHRQRNFRGAQVQQRVHRQRNVVLKKIVFVVLRDGHESGFVAFVLVIVARLFCSLQWRQLLDLHLVTGLESFFCFEI